jgi:flagellin
MASVGIATASENMQAAESRIRDADMATEIVAFTRSQILQQASTAMLAQANNQNASVLKLLS